ncbi:MAG TPA: hypothetical protein VFA49_14670 [Chloroflexota bacterium]|jgi:hypothetical protein|nr:hypothetical protein [Chloroflexota bacterium]
MVLTPTGRSPENFSEPVPETAPQRGRRIVQPVPTPDTALAWRAVVHAADRDAARTAWHLASCQDTNDPGAHCPEGQRLIETSGEPDGHCLIDERCPRCEAAGHMARAG